MRHASLLALHLLIAGCSTPQPRVSPLQPKAPIAAMPPIQAPEPVVCALADGLARLSTSTNPDPAQSVSRDNLRIVVDTLSDPALQGRAGGSAENRQVAHWIAKTFASYGLQAPKGTDHCVTFEHRGIRDQNVIAHLRRNADTNAPFVLVGAHYDAQGKEGSDVYPGADDNASGVAAMLEIARVSTQISSGPNMVFVAFGAEEHGLLGAKAYVAAPTIALSDLALMVNLDMVGRPALDGLPIRLLISNADETIGYVIGDRDKPSTEDMLARAAERQSQHIIGIPETMLRRLGFGSDSVPFSPHVPTIFLSTGAHADYHQPSDTADKVDIDQIARAANLVLAITGEIQSK